jgi:hypothetical protein
LSPWRRVAAALIAVAIALAVTTLLVAIDEMIETGHSSFSPMPASILVFSLTMYAIVGLPAALVLIVLGWLLEGMKRTGALAHSLAGTASGALGVALFIFVQTARTAREFPPESASLFAWRLGVGALFGVTSSLALWWLTRRRDKPFWSDVF